MADALCGPSNPLQAFQKATSVDRTFQQDRLRSHLPPGTTQGFRSPDSRAGSLDAEFAAFEAGRPLDQNQPLLPHTQFFSPSASQHDIHPQNAVGASWAADFQRLQLRSPAPALNPIPPNQFRTEAPLQRSTSGTEWHTEFMKRQQLSGASGRILDVPAAQNLRQPNAPLNAGPSFSPPVAYDFYQSQALSSPVNYSQIQQNQTSGMHLDVLDEAAFEAAFTEAASADLQTTPSSANKKTLQQPQRQREPFTVDDATNLESASRTDSQLPLFQLDNLPKIGSDLIPPKPRPVDTVSHSHSDPQPQAQQRPSAMESDSDSLALTAGELLHSVRDDSSEKFRQSNFLALMRRLRDREVVVRGDDIVESRPPDSPPTNMDNVSPSVATPDSDSDSDHFSSSALHPGGPSYPSDLSSPSPLAPAVDDVNMDSFRASANQREEHFLDTRPF